MTRAGAARAAAARLREAGVATPDLDARVLALAAFAVDLATFVARGDVEATEAEVEALQRLVARRLAGEPVSRILGRREFWGLSFDLSPAALTPRPDTETVVEAALAALVDRKRPWRILDLGVGSGCILLALLSELPHAEGVGVDRSIEAARTARRNAERLGFGLRAMTLVGDWGAALGARFDLVVSNPPYIPTDAVARLDVEVRAHDPMAALDGGPDGLDAYRAIVAALPALLAPGAPAVLELGAGQEKAVAALARDRGLGVVEPARRDLAGVGRALVLRQSAEPYRAIAKNTLE